MRDQFRLILFILTLLFFTGSAMTASVAVCQQMPKDTAVKTKLLKRITEMLQFRKNVRRREQQRVITIVNGLFVDSLVATPAAIKYLNWALDNDRNQNFEHLRQLLNDSLSKRKPATDTVLVKATITEEEMNELAAKLIPLLQQKEVEVKDDTAQQQRLRTIRALYNRPPDQIDTFRLNDTTGRTYKIRLAHLAEVIGIQSRDNGNAYLNYNFTTLSYLSVAPPGSADLLSAARKDGCKTLFTVNVTSQLLQQEEQQYLLADSIFAIMYEKDAAGINVWMKGLKEGERDAFTRFVTILHNYFDHNKPGKYSISLTIPAYDKNKAYDLRELAPLVRYFLIDFTTPPAPPAAMGSSDPLKGNNYSIVSVVSRYVNQHVDPERFILMLPYDGIKWKGNSYSFMSYKEIRKAYPADSMISYDVTAASAYIADGASQIWFNDPTTLDVKYDYVLRNGLGGVAICPLGADDGYGELWDELTDKFVVPDTVWMKEVRLTPLPVEKPGLWVRIKKRIKHELRAIHQLLKDPCSIDTRNYNSDEYFRYLTMFLFVCVVVIGVVYLYNVRMKGTDWDLRRRVLYLWVAVIVLAVLSCIVSLMLAKRLPSLGFTDDPVECRSISLYNVLVVFLIGIALGMVLMRVFVFPLLRKREIP